MKMFLTRMGFGSKCVVTGDVSQVDLPRGTGSGLIDAEQVLRRVKGVGFTRFSAADVVRHPLVARIVQAYDRADRKAANPAPAGAAGVAAAVGGPRRAGPRREPGDAA
jgi:phosphate starvation-inducible protein PhoH